MIRYRYKIFEDYFIDKDTAIITDKFGNVQQTRFCQGREFFRKMPVHCIQAHTAWGYKKGFDVHHDDKNKLNNALCNLVYKPRSKHISEHMKGKKHHLGKKSTKPRSSESRIKSAASMIGRKWFNDGVKNYLVYECPKGCVKGMIK